MVPGTVFKSFNIPENAIALRFIKLVKCRHKHSCICIDINNIIFMILTASSGRIHP